MKLHNNHYGILTIEGMAIKFRLLNAATIVRNGKKLFIGSGNTSHDGYCNNHYYYLKLLTSTIEFFLCFLFVLLLNTTEEIYIRLFKKS